MLGYLQYSRNMRETENDPASTVKCLINKLPFSFFFRREAAISSQISYCRSVPFHFRLLSMRLNSRQSQTPLSGGLVSDCVNAWINLSISSYLFFSLCVQPCSSCQRRFVKPIPAKMYQYSGNKAKADHPMRS